MTDLCVWSAPRWLAVSLLLSALGLFPAAAWAQAPARIDGVILDAETQERVVGVTVELASAAGESAGSTVSDSKGAFTFDGLPAGGYEIAVSHLRYGRSTDSLTLASGERVAVEYRVSARAIEVAGLSVTARARQGAPDIARGTRVDGMTATEIEEIRPRISSMSDLLRAGRVAGLSVTELGGRICVEPNRARGGVQSLPGQCAMVTVVVDGVILSNPEERLALLSPEAVESWELLPALEAGTRYGSVSGNGVLEITTRSGTRLPQGFEGIARFGQRWAISAALVANGGSTLHEGVVRVITPERLAGLSYTEHTNGSPGLEVAARWNSRSFGYLGVDAYGSFGTSTATYNTGQGGDRIAERDYSTFGLDVWWGAPVLRRDAWNASLAIGPAFQWQWLDVAGHPDELAAPGATDPPDVEWTDRSWFAPGAAFRADLAYDFAASAGAYVGFHFRLLSTGGTGTWATQDEAAILGATGTAVQVTYDSGLAGALGIRTGLRWYP